MHTGYHLYPRFERLSGNERRRLMNSIRERIPLDNLKDALRIDSRSCAQIEDALVTSQFPFNIEPGGSVPNDWMKEEDRAEQGLKDNDAVVPSTQVDPLVPQDCDSLVGVCPGTYVVGEQDHRTKKSSEQW